VEEKFRSRAGCQMQAALSELPFLAPCSVNFYVIIILKGPQGKKQKA
jgi:hypothetical protein